MAQFDVTTFIRTLRASGVPEEIAMAHAEAVANLVHDNFATRAHLNSFANDLLTEINHVRDSLRFEITGIEDRLKAEMKVIEDRLTAKVEREILALEKRLLLKFGGMLVTGIGLLAIFQTLLK